MSGLRCPDCKQPISDDDVICPHCGVNLEEPIELETPIIVASSPDRGVWLTIMLGLWFISNSVITIYYLITTLAGNQSISFLYSVWMILRGSVNVVSVVAIWKWKKWGVYGLLTTLVLGALIDLIVIGNPVIYIGSIIGVFVAAGILYLLLRRVWYQMD